jgi:hypothetical protein
MCSLPETIRPILQIGEKIWNGKEYIAQAYPDISRMMKET